MSDATQIKVAFESDSEQGIRYTVDYFEGKWFCKCPAFRMNGEGYMCKHIYRWQEAYKSALKAAAKNTAPEKFTKLKKARYGTEEKPIVAGQYYNFGKGMEYGRVTSILSECKNPDSLINWAAELGAKAMRDSYDVAMDNLIRLVIDRHKDGGPEETAHAIASAVAKAALSVEEARMAPFYYKQKKAKIGTNVHDYLEIFNSDQPDRSINELTPSERPYVYAFLNWVNQIGRENIVTLAQEKPVFSKKHKYAGKFDWIASINGKTWLLDFKTSKWVFDDVGLQLKAYAEAILEMKLIDKIDYMGVVHLRPDEQGLLLPFDEPLKPFLGMRDVWQWRQSKKQG